MTTIHAQVPDYLAALAAEAAVKECTTVDQIVAVALSSQLGAWQVRADLETRAQRGHPDDLKRLLDRVPDVPPLPGDEL